ncbi:MAG TPA: FAD-dependent oxidoreductase [Thermoleophilaceae bacterium]|nr:FAD-dependent oxidoreductase [Thermoleophilaceae bacterium]
MRSLWFEDVMRPQRAPLEHDVSVDVAVLGAGIVGLTTALLLERNGARVAVVEARRVAAGASGYNTAKLSSLHGLSYRKLAGSLGAEAARTYGEANEAGIARVFELAGELGIDCDLRRKPNYTYTESRSDLDQVREEAGVALGLGLPASFVEEVDLPFAVAGAVRFDEQAEFHPVKYLEGLAAALDGHVYEGTMATRVHGGRVTTAGGQVVNAENVVVATHLPFLDRGLYFARCHPERSYVIAGRTTDPPAGMYLSTEQPAHSIRAHGDWLLVGGESHKTGQADAAERYARLEAWARERFGIEPELRWATQDHMPVDGVPYVGRHDPLSSGVWVATGFRKWGLAMGTAAAELLAARIAGRDHAWAELFDPQRLRPRASATSFVKENANVALRFFGDRVVKRGDVAEIAPGEGRIVGAGLGQRAVYRDDDGTLHELSARCTHLGCIVNWNTAERTWDCPCHGSRFAADGGVIEGPAVRSLRGGVRHDGR